MLIITAPAKTLDLTSNYKVKAIYQPQFPQEASEIRDQIAKMSEAELARFMKINEKIAAENFQRYQNWTLKHQEPQSRPALHCYKGDIYKQMHPETYTPEQQAYAQESIRILSGLYGVLRGYDLMQPYRLEMKQKMQVGEAKNLPEFWRPLVTASLNNDIQSQGHKFLLHLASEEYAAAINFKQLNCPVVKVEFREKQPDGTSKITPIYSKQARGMIMEFCIQNQINSVQELKQFSTANYQFQEGTDTSLVFSRG